MPEQITISIINHNSVQPLLRCVKSLLASDLRQSVSIYVVDNLCEDRAISVLSRCYPQINIISNSEVRGFSANHNQVIRAATSKYVLLINPDVELHQGALGEMMNVMDARPDVAAVGPCIHDADGVLSRPLFRAFDLWRELVYSSLYFSLVSGKCLARLERLKESARHTMGILREVTTKLAKRSQSGVSSRSFTADMDVAVIRGACMFIRMKAIEDVGLFDERFFLYWEENDWCLRAKRAGWRIVYRATARAYHEGGRSTKNNYLKYLTIYGESLMKFYNKHARRSTFLVLQTWLTSLGIVNLLRWKVQSVLHPTDVGSREKVVFAKNLLSVLRKAK